MRRIRLTVSEELLSYDGKPRPEPEGDDGGGYEDEDAEDGDCHVVLVRRVVEVGKLAFRRLHGRRLRAYLRHFCRSKTAPSLNSGSMMRGCLEVARTCARGSYFRGSRSSVGGVVGGGKIFLFRAPALPEWKSKDGNWIRNDCPGIRVRRAIHAPRRRKDGGGTAECIHVHAMHAEEQCRSRLEVSLDHCQEGPPGPHRASHHGNCLTVLITHRADERLGPRCTATLTSSLARPMLLRVSKSYRCRSLEKSSYDR